jgi:FtsH-binding integral membrane protein
MATTANLQATSEIRINRFLALIYMIMALGMLVTALVATQISTNEELITRIVFDPWFAFGLLLIQIVIVVLLSAAVMRLSPAIAFLIFLIYSALTGLSISGIFIFYTQNVIAHTFWIAAGMFFLTSIIGLVIKRDLSGIGLFLLMILMGWIFSGIFLWIFPFSQGLNQAYNFSGILIFAALTVWDTQRLKELGKQLEGRQGMGGLAVLGALSLYLDFINLFLLLLRTSRRQ